MPRVRLTLDQLTTLQEAQRILHDVLPDIDALEKCGRNCQELRAKAQRAREEIEAVTANFPAETLRS